MGFRTFGLLEITFGLLEICMNKTESENNLVNKTHTQIYLHGKNNVKCKKKLRFTCHITTKLSDIVNIYIKVHILTVLCILAINAYMKCPWHKRDFNQQST